MMFGSSADHVSVELPERLTERVDSLLRAGQYYDAIKLVRKETGAGLVVGTRAVDHRKEALAAG